MTSKSALETSLVSGDLSFPYNLQRRIGPPQFEEPEKRPSLIYKKPSDGVSDVEDKLKIPHYVVRGPVSTPGRVVYRNKLLRNKEFGFEPEQYFDLSTITRSELRYVRRKTIDWVKETNYTPNRIERRPFWVIWQARFSGLFAGGVLFYYGCEYIPKLFCKLTPRTRIACSLVNGLIVSCFYANWSKAAVYSEVLKLNSPLGYKGRQHLQELRARHDQLETMEELIARKG